MNHIQYIEIIPNFVKSKRKSSLSSFEYRTNCEQILFKHHICYTKYQTQIICDECDVMCFGHIDLCNKFT